MKFTILICFILAFTIYDILSISSQTDFEKFTSAKDYVPYTDYRHGIKMWYPDYWYNDLDENDTAFLSLRIPGVMLNNSDSLHDTPFIQLEANNTLVPVTLNKALIDAINFFKTEIAMQNITTANTTLGGFPAVKFDYDSANTRKHPIHVMEIIVITKNIIYYFDYYAEQKDYIRFLPDVINMTNNIEFNISTNFK